MPRLSPIPRALSPLPPSPKRPARESVGLPALTPFTPFPPPAGRPPQAPLLANPTLTPLTPLPPTSTLTAFVEPALPSPAPTCPALPCPALPGFEDSFPSPDYDPEMLAHVDQIVRDLTADNGPPPPPPLQDTPQAGVEVPESVALYLQPPPAEKYGILPRAVDRRVLGLTTGGAKNVEIGIDLLTMEPYGMLTGQHARQPVWIRLTCVELSLFSQDFILERLVRGFHDPHDRVTFLLGGLEISYRVAGATYLCLKRHEEDKKLLYTLQTVQTWLGLIPAVQEILQGRLALVPHVTAVVQDMIDRVVTEVQSCVQQPATLADRKALVRELLRTKTLACPNNAQWDLIMNTAVLPLWHELKETHFLVLFERIQNRLWP